jgi:four helix bundle protein
MVYEAIKNSPQFQKDFRLVGQITDAAGSSMRNIAEGFSRRFDKEFIQFLFISKSSATEVQSEAYVALDQKYISQDEFQKIYNQAEKVSKMDSAFITYLLQSNKRPNRHKGLKGLKGLQGLNRPDGPNRPEGSV